MLPSYFYIKFQDQSLTKAKSKARHKPPTSPVPKLSLTWGDFSGLRKKQSKKINITYSPLNPENSPEHVWSAEHQRKPPFWYLQGTRGNPDELYLLSAVAHLESHTELKGVFSILRAKGHRYFTENFDACDFVWTIAFQTVGSHAGNWTGICESQDFPMALSFFNPQNKSKNPPKLPDFPRFPRFVKGVWFRKFPSLLQETLFFGLSSFHLAPSFATDLKLFTPSVVSYIINPTLLLYFVCRTEIQCGLNTSDFTILLLKLPVSEKGFFFSLVPNVLLNLCFKALLVTFILKKCFILTSHPCILNL